MSTSRENCIKYLTENYHESNQVEAVEQLRNYNDQESLVLLTKALLNNESKKVREKAAESLGTMGDKRTVDFLKKALNDQVNVAMASWNAIKKIGGPEAQEIIQQGPPTLKFSMVVFRWRNISFWKSLFAKSPPEGIEYAEKIALQHFKTFPIKIDIWRVVGVKRELSAGQAASLYHNMIREGRLPNFGNIRATTDYMVPDGKDEFGFGYVAIFFP